jgi:hypothetical protein
LYTLVQNSQVNLQYCIDGYNKSVLLKNSFNPVGNKPTELCKPDKNIFLNKIRELADDGYFIDIYIFAHGTTDRISINDSVTLTETEIKSALSPGVTGYDQLPIRMVYQMNCYGHTLNQTWLDLGAKISCGAREVNFYPNQFNGFAKEWKQGNNSFKSALIGSNTASSRTVMQALIQADAAKDLFPKKWDKCPLFKTVLGDHSCAKSYFQGVWGIDQWQQGESGAENMNYSSYMYRVGNTELSFNSRSELAWNK